MQGGSIATTSKSSNNSFNSQILGFLVFIFSISVAYYLVIVKGRTRGSFFINLIKNKK